MAFDDISALIESIPYEERAAGGKTTQMLAHALAAKAVKKLEGSLHFQDEAKRRNREEFGPAFNMQQQQEQESTLDEHEMAPPWQPLDEMEVPQAAPEPAPGEGANESGGSGEEELFGSNE